MQHSTRTIVGRLAGAVIVQLLAACAVLVDPEALLLRCELDPADPTRDPCLGLGLSCIDGMCRSSEEQPVCDPHTREICDQIDNDCDGVIDEGQDQDGDGFTWCRGGELALRDCDDDDPEVHPPAPGADGTTPGKSLDLCDGKDNDCDDKFDEDESCPQLKRCVELGCPEGQVCDAPSGVCFLPRRAGSDCRTDADCMAGFCLRTGAFGLPVSLMDNRCATACCSSADCQNGQICLVSELGARVCLPENIALNGSKNLNEVCASDAECASGLCVRGTCQTRCLNSDECGDSTCVLSLGASTEARVFMCGQPAGRASAGEGCRLVNCRSGFCRDDMTCAAPCARDLDCADDSMCAFVDVRPALRGVISTVSVCARRPAGDTSMLERLCCTNADCGGGELCAPSGSGGNQPWHMNCRPAEQPSPM